MHVRRRFCNLNRPTVSIFKREQSSLNPWKCALHPLVRPGWLWYHQHLGMQLGQSTTSEMGCVIGVLSCGIDNTLVISCLREPLIGFTAVVRSVILPLAPVHLRPQCLLILDFASKPRCPAASATPSYTRTFTGPTTEQPFRVNEAPYVQAFVHTVSDTRIQWQFAILTASAFGLYHSILDPCGDVPRT